MPTALQKQTYANPRMTEWQVDRAKRSAAHISGLVISWQVVGKGKMRQPALDIAGLQKVTATPWAGQINQLVDQAIALLGDA